MNRKKLLWLLAVLTLVASATFGQDPYGQPLEPSDEINDQRAGSMLIYNYYTSNTTGSQSDTRISLTNTNEAVGVKLKLAFIDGVTGAVGMINFDLLPGQSRTLLASQVDPNITGYLMAVAVNTDGIPVQFDHLIGTATIRLQTSYLCTLAALAVPINPNGFYAALPRQLALDSVGPPSNLERRLLILNRIDGSIMNGAHMQALGALEGEFYNGSGSSRTLRSPVYGPQAIVYATANDLFEQPPIWSLFFPAGQRGWLHLQPSGVGAMTGAVLLFEYAPPGTFTRPSPASYNLHQLTNTPATLETSGGTMAFGY